MNTLEKTETILQWVNLGVVEFVSRYDYRLVNLETGEHIKYLDGFDYTEFGFDLYDFEHIDIAWLILQRVKPANIDTTAPTIHMAQEQWMDGVFEQVMVLQSIRSEVLPFKRYNIPSVVDYYRKLQVKYHVLCVAVHPTTFENIVHGWLEDYLYANHTISTTGIAYSGQKPAIHINEIMHGAQQMINRRWLNFDGTMVPVIDFDEEDKIQFIYAPISTKVT